MSDPALCKHEILKASCALCTPPKPDRTNPLREMARGLRRTMRANFDSKCPGCGDDIYEDDEITMDDGTWVCGGCASE